MTESPGHEILSAVKEAVPSAHLKIVEGFDTRNDIARKARLFGNNKFHISVSSAVGLIRILRIS